MSGKDKLMVLVVEDNPDMQAIYARILDGAGHDYIQVFNAKDAMKALADHKIDLVILDVLLPDGVLGFTFLSQLRDRRHLRKLPVIIVTVLDCGDVEAKLAGQQHVCCMSKPFDEVELLSLFSGCIRGECQKR